MYDLIIRNGMVVDGTRAPAYQADVCIQNGRIAEITAQCGAEAKEVIDAAGKVVSPGFIDIHTHSDLAPLSPFDPESIASTDNFYQGIDYFMMPSLRNIGFSLSFKF